MGVYIRGMEMPKSCKACQLERSQDTQYDFEFRCCPITGTQTNRYFNERPENCPLTPAADVREVKRGKWKLATYSGKFGSAKGKWYDQFLDGAFWYCGNCKERAAKKTNFCPNCGARMVNDDV